MVSKSVSVIISCMALWGCGVPVPGRVEVIKGSIHAQGTVAISERGGVLIRSMHIDLTTAPSDLLKDIWLEISAEGKIRLSDISPQLLKQQGFNEKTVEPQHDGETISFSSDGFTFHFDNNGKLISLDANTGSNDDTSTENPRMGVFSNHYSLALPCSLPQFRSVFGKPSKMRFLKNKDHMYNK